MLRDLNPSLPFSRGVSLSLAASLTLAFALSFPALANEPATTSSAPAVNTGSATNSTIGNNNYTASDVGIAVNGNAQGNLNNNQNLLRNGDNTNTIQLRTTNYNPTSGGNSTLVLPRNPLSLPNANLGRSNFGLQFGVNNNPVATTTGGSGNALGWFMQGGVTIPFGKIPDVYRDQKTAALDELRERDVERERMVFGAVRSNSQNNNSITPAQTQVQGRVVGLSAYNYATIPSAKISLNPAQAATTLSGEPALSMSAQPPRVLALLKADVFTQPLNTGEKIGLLEVGHEYPYLGHTRSGWVKVLLPNGTQGWTSTKLEYIKNDFTEIDSLAAAPVTLESKAQAKETLGFSPLKLKKAVSKVSQFN